MSSTVNINERGAIRKTLEGIQEGLTDVRNVVQLLEISLQSNEDDLHIIQSVHLIGKMVFALSEKCNTILNMDSDCESSRQ